MKTIAMAGVCGLSMQLMIILFTLPVFAAAPEPNPVMAAALADLAKVATAMCRMREEVFPVQERVRIRQKLGPSLGRPPPPPECGDSPAAGTFGAQVGGAAPMLIPGGGAGGDNYRDSAVQ